MPANIALGVEDDNQAEGGHPLRNRVRIGQHFWLYEFEDTRAGGVVMIQPELVNALDRLREEIARPILVTSGYRTLYTNGIVGGARHSQHMYGRAADIVARGMPVDVLAARARDYFSFIKVYPNHVHVDVRE